MIKNIVDKIIREKWITKDELQMFLQNWSIPDRKPERNLHSRFNHVLDVLLHPEWGYPHSYSTWWTLDRKRREAKFFFSFEEVCVLLNNFSWDLLKPGVRFYESILAELEQ